MLEIGPDFKHFMGFLLSQIQRYFSKALFAVFEGV